MKPLIKWISLLLFIVSLSTCANPTVLVKDMAAFDRAYIPVFYYTYNNQQEEAKKAMLYLNQQWGHFSKKYSKAYASSEDWMESIRRMAVWIDGAKCALEDGDTQQAFFQLDHARYELMDIRWRGNIDYYLDYVWDLEATISIAKEVANDPMLELMDWNDFIMISKDVQTAYEEMAEQKMNMGRYNMSNSKQLVLIEKQKELKTSIDAFLDAVNCADGCVFAEKSIEMESAYLNYLHVFGDFESVQRFYAKL